MRRILLLALFFAVLTVHAAPAEWQPITAEMRKAGISMIGAIACDPAKGKLYLGCRSDDAQRRGLLVYDIKDGKVVGQPRRYADSPEPLPAGHWSLIRSLYLDAKHHKLFLGLGTSHGAADNTKTLVRYDLDAKGEPVGQPQAFEDGNQYKYTEAIAAHPTLDRLYLGGFGMGDISSIDLDATGTPGAPAIQRVGGIGKPCLAVRADGSKLYMGTHPGRLQVMDLDAKGNVTGAVRWYSFAGSETMGYLTFAATPRAIYFKGPDGTLSYFLLDAASEPVGTPTTRQNEFTVELHKVDGPKIDAVAPGTAPNRLLIAVNDGFTDAITGKWVTLGAQVKEIALNADGTPGADMRAGARYPYQSVAALAGNTAPVAVLSQLSGIAGSRFSGLRVRATLLSVESSDPLQPLFRTVAMGGNKYLHFAYSTKYNRVYATGDDTLTIYTLNDLQAKVETIPYPGVTGAIAVDDVANRLYLAGKDGLVHCQRLEADGRLAGEGEKIPVGINPVGALGINSKTHQVYAVGPEDKAAKVSADALARNALVPVAGPAWPGTAVVDAERGRLYVSTSLTGNRNLWVWRLKADGTLAGLPDTYLDGTEPGQNKLRGRAPSLVLDAVRHKLYLGACPENSAKGQGMLTVYDLYANGDPAGARKYPSSNQYGYVDAVGLAKNGGWLYEGGFGDPNVYAHKLDAAGEPTGEVMTFPLVGSGKSQLEMTADGATLLVGGHPCQLNLVAMLPDGLARSGVKATLVTDHPVNEKRNIDLGLVFQGEPTPWIDLDDVLKNRWGSSILRLYANSPVASKMSVQFEVALAGKDGMTPLRTVTSTVSGNYAALFVPRYLQEDVSNLSAMVQTSAERYRFYLAWAQKYGLKPEERPKQFVVANGLIGVDGNLEALDAGMKLLAVLGHNTAQIWGWPGIAPADVRATAAKYGFNRFRQAVYNPPSYFSFDTDKVQPAFLDKWANDLKSGVTAMGAKPEETVLYHMADEPGWYYPHNIDYVREKPERLAVFRNYLKGKGFTPAFFGKTSWDEIIPIKPSQVKTLEDRRLFFWTVRFYPESLSQGFAAATQALQRNYSPKLLVGTNLNNWPGLYYRAAPNETVANNWDKGPDAGMGLPDWFDLGRKKAVSALWTEDWFGDADAGQWSMYTDLMRCAAREGGIEYGAYVVGGVTGHFPDGGTYKIMALAGHGAKAIDPYIFGPNAAFGDGWSEGEQCYKSLADGLRVLGKGERLLYPGRPRTGTVAVLFPQASQVWEPNLQSYYPENDIYGLYAGLTHAHYPVDFIDDFGVEGGELAKYGYPVLYVTAPNLSVKAQTAILQWVQAGGTLVLFPNACTADEYNTPTTILPGAPAPREPLPPAYKAILLPKQPITVKDARLGAAADATGLQTVALPAGGNPLALFADGKTAVDARAVGKGRIIRFGYWPGSTYWNSPDRNDRTALPYGWSTATRSILTFPARLAGAKKHVDISADLVEGTLLESPKGIAVTLLNWSGNPQQSVTVTIANPGKVIKVESVRRGALPFRITPAGLTVTLPLATVDVLLLSR